MRLCSICAILLAACGSTKRAPPLESLKLTKVVFRQYYAGSPIFVLENLAGRDIVKLRSQPARQREVRPAYIPDEVMSKLLSEFKRYGFYDYSGPRPPNPLKVGGRAELTVIGTGRYLDHRGRPHDAFIRRDQQGKGGYKTYKKCVDAFRAVHAHYGKFQTTTGAGNFGVKRTGFER